MDQYLSSTYYIDADNPSVREFARDAVAGETGDRRQAVALYYAVRDGIRYDATRFNFEPATYPASVTLARGDGFCVQKAILMAAAARSLGIPARPGYANVRNHLATPRLVELMRTDIFVFHGYVELYLGDAWVKSTPVFNRSLCERFNLLPLEFDGEHDSIFHPFDKTGQKHMDYLHDYGTFPDFPLELMIGECKKYYPHLFQSA